MKIETINAESESEKENVESRERGRAIYNRINPEGTEYQSLLEAIPALSNQELQDLARYYFGAAAVGYRRMWCALAASLRGREQVPEGFAFVRVPERWNLTVAPRPSLEWVRENVDAIAPFVTRRMAAKAGAKEFEVVSYEYRMVPPGPDLSTP